MPTRKDKPGTPAPKGGGPSKKSKSPKPSFAVGGALPVQPKTGWVYRSDATAAPTPQRAPAPRTPEPQNLRTPEPRNQWKGWLQEGGEAVLLPLQFALILALAPIGLLVSRGAKDRK